MIGDDKEWVQSAFDMPWKTFNEFFPHVVASGVLLQAYHAKDSDFVINAEMMATECACGSEYREGPSWPVQKVRPRVASAWTYHPTHTPTLSFLCVLLAGRAHLLPPPPPLCLRPSPPLAVASSSVSG